MDENISSDYNCLRAGFCFLVKDISTNFYFVHVVGMESKVTQL